MVVGIDLALRRTGVVALALDGSLCHHSVFGNSDRDISPEDLLRYNQKQLAELLDNPAILPGAVVALEGLVFGGSKVSADRTAANHWLTRLAITERGHRMNVIHPRIWQHDVITPAARQQVATLKGFPRRKALKEVVVACLPPEVIYDFNYYVSSNGLPYDALWDLADAYFIAKYELDSRR